MKTTQIQGIGTVEAKPAVEFQVGEKMLWNFGYASTVSAIIDETPKFMTVELTCEKGTFQRRLKKDRLVAVA